MALGRINLVMKDERKAAEGRNFRPIACLQTTIKLLTGIIAEQAYAHVNQHGLLPVEQKGCRKGSRGTTDYFLVDKMAMKNCSRRHAS